MHLSKIGEIVRDEWIRTPTVRSNVDLDEFVIMPDHLHGVLILRSNRPGESQFARTEETFVNEWRFDETLTTPFRSPSKTIGAIVRGFKGSSTKQINVYRGTPGLPVWQRNYYEHIVRDDDALARIRTYIRNNPANWRKGKKN